MDEIFNQVDKMEPVIGVAYLKGVIVRMEKEIAIVKGKCEQRQSRINEMMNSCINCTNLHSQKPFIIAKMVEVNKE